MRELVQGARRLSKSLDALGARLARREMTKPISKVDEDDLFKAVATAPYSSAAPGVIAAPTTSGAPTSVAASKVPAAKEDEEQASKSLKAPMVGKNRITLLKYSPDQPRDEQGRWTTGGVVAATAAGVLGAAGLIGGGLLLARAGGFRNILGGAAARSERFRQVSVRPMPKAGPKPAAAAARAGKDTKPFHQLSPRQQARRMKAFMAAAVARGVPKAEAKVMAEQMKAQALAAGAAAAAGATALASRAAAGARRVVTTRTPTNKPAVPLTTDMVMRERARVDALKDTYDALFRQHAALAGKGEPTRMAALSSQMDKLAREISTREASLVARYGAWTRGSFKPPPPPATKPPSGITDQTPRVRVRSKLGQ